MIFREKELTGGRALRSVRAEDAFERERFFRRLHTGCATLASEADELTGDLELVEAMIEDTAESDDAAELAVFGAEGMLALAALSPVTRAHRRRAHRCAVSVGTDTAFRGQGLARLLLTELLALARRTGYEQAELNVTADNAAAIALYTSLGFEVCGRIPRALRMEGGGYTDELMMIKRLEETV